MGWGDPRPLWMEEGRDPLPCEGGRPSEIGEEGMVGVGDRGEEEEEMLSASTDEARRTRGGEGVRELSGSQVQFMIIC